jgi:endonuclease G
VRPPWYLALVLVACSAPPAARSLAGDSRDASRDVLSGTADARGPLEPDVAPDLAAAAVDGSVPVDSRDAALGTDSSIGSSVHVALGIPTDSDGSDDVLLDHQYFIVSYNPRRLDANWVAWHLAAADLGSVRRQDDYRADDALPPAVHRVQAGDFAGSGYDRGHLCPSADRTATVAMNSATFLMTNMVPQLHALNAGPWEALEFQERQFVVSGTKEAYIVAGPVFGPNAARIGPGIEVPAADFKIIVVVDQGADIRHLDASAPAYAVIMPHTAEVAGKLWSDYLVSIDDVEKQTGYDFLNALPVDVQATIEARIATP